MGAQRSKEGTGQTRDLTKAVRPPDAHDPGLGAEVAIVDPPPEPLLRVGQEHCESVSLGVLEVDTDGVASEFWDTNISDDGASSDVVALGGERGDAGADDVSGWRVFFVGVGSSGDHFGLPVAADGRAIREELAPAVELLLPRGSTVARSRSSAVERIIRAGSYSA